jgi:hypothetical protein
MRVWGGRVKERRGSSRLCLGPQAILETFAVALAARIPESREWTLLLEYAVPRRNKFPDAILLADDLTFLIEFKAGATEFDSAASWQVEDYALEWESWGTRIRT